MNYAPPGRTPDTMTAAFITDEQSARRVAASFTAAFGAADVAIGLADTGQGQWRVTFYFPGEIDEATARDLTIAAVGAEKGRALRFERVAAKDWVADSLKELKPIAAGRFVVHGGHDRGCVPANRIGIEIDAALAFGTGHHGTTRGCLLALDRIVKARRHRPAASRPSAHARRRRKQTVALDVGTGTGVLAIAVAKSLHRPVLASDLD